MFIKYLERPKRSWLLLDLQIAPDESVYGSDVKVKEATVCVKRVSVCLMQHSKEAFENEHPIVA